MRLSSTALTATLVCLLSSYASAHTISRLAANSLIQSDIKVRNIEAVVSDDCDDQEPEPSSVDGAASVEEDCDEADEADDDDDDDDDDDCDDIADEDDCDDENDDADEDDDCDEDSTTPSPVPQSRTPASAHAGVKTAQTATPATPAATSTGPAQQNLAQTPRPSSSVATASEHADCEIVSDQSGSADSQIKTVYITVTQTASLNTAMLAAKPTGISNTDPTSSFVSPQPSSTPATPKTADDAGDDEEIPFCDEETDTTTIASPAAQKPTTALSAASPAKTSQDTATTGQGSAAEDGEPECDDEEDEEGSEDDEECDSDSANDQIEEEDCEEDTEPATMSSNSNLFASPQREDGANANFTVGAGSKSNDKTDPELISAASRTIPAVASGTAVNVVLAEQGPDDGRDGLATGTGAVSATVAAADAGRRRRARRWVG